MLGFIAIMIPTLSTEAVRSFQQIYEEEFDEPLSDDEADMLGKRVLRLFAILNESDCNTIASR